MARPGKIDIDDFLNRGGAITHHQHAIRKLDCFFEVVRDEKNCFLFALLNAHQIGTHFSVRKRLEEIAFFPVSRNDTLTI